MENSMTISTALTNYAASGKTAGNAWAEVVNDFTTDNNTEAFKKRCKDAVEEFKNKHNKAADTTVIDNAINSLRSAQSVVIGASSAGIPLLKEDGSPVAKTALQTAIKQHKVAMGPPKTTTDRDRIQSAMTILGNCTCDTYDVLVQLNTILDKL
jgi:hypothetical protein